jgi:hypothetical protein
MDTHTNHFDVRRIENPASSSLPSSLLFSAVDMDHLPVDKITLILICSDSSSSLKKLFIQDLVYKINIGSI